MNGCGPVGGVHLAALERRRHGGKGQVVDLDRLVGQPALLQDLDEGVLGHGALVDRHGLALELGDLLDRGPRRHHHREGRRAPGHSLLHPDHLDRVPRGLGEDRRGLGHEPHVDGPPGLGGDDRRPAEEVAPAHAWATLKGIPALGDRLVVLDLVAEVDAHAREVDRCRGAGALGLGGPGRAGRRDAERHRSQPRIATAIPPRHAHRRLPPRRRRPRRPAPGAVGVVTSMVSPRGGGSPGPTFRRDRIGKQPDWICQL